MQRLAVYPGTFDPITMGHVDVTQRGLKMFERIVIAVADNPEKKPFYSLQQRLAMVSESFADEPRVQTIAFKGLLVDVAQQQQACAILRGLRAASDFEYEFQMAAMNRRLDAQLETVFVMAREEYTFVSSRFIREVSSMGGDVRNLTPKAVQKHLHHLILRPSNEA